jgi:hypothetical protein
MMMKHKVAGARLNGCISTADSNAFMSTSSPWGFQTPKICGIGFVVAAPVFAYTCSTWSVPSNLTLTRSGLFVP